ncbi:MAG: UDP-3-O-(3-hydroxymyristoyl)glucosamine N-acyltransferase [Terriglobia bacterium]
MTAKELASLLGGKLQGDGAREIRGVSTLESAGPDDLTFAEGDRALEQAAASAAGCILVPEAATLAGVAATIAVEHPKLAFVRAVEVLCPSPKPDPGIHPSAVVAADAVLAADVSVGPNVVIERGAKIGAGTRLDAGVVIGAGTEVGTDCRFHPRVVVYPGARIGNRVILHAGVVIGSDGFGYVLAEGRYHKFPQLGRAILEDDVEIGSNSTVDRGSLGTTVIGQGTKIDNLCQVAHNVTIGRHCVIAAQTGIAGSVEIGNYVVMAGQVGIADHIRIEDNVQIGGHSAIFPGKIVRRGSVVWGSPARPIGDYKKQQACLAQLPRLIEKVKELARRVDKG